MGSLIDRAVGSDPIPVAIVGQAGQAIILTAGESGVIWRQGEETPAQASQIQTISDALEALAGSEPRKTPKRRKPQQSRDPEPELEVLAASIEEAAETRESEPMLEPQAQPEPELEVPMASEEEA